MAKKKTRLKLAQEQAQKAIEKTNNKIDTLGLYTSAIYDSLNNIQLLFDRICNVPSEKTLQYEKLKNIRLNWKQQADKLDENFKAALAKNAGGGAGAAGLGVAVAALGPTAAMGIATTFGVASTGTAISALSGAAATNAALAWLGGGALAVGGGGMAAGETLLLLAGPVGWAIAGAAIVGSGLVFWKTKSDQQRLEDIYTFISERDINSYNLAIIEINERIKRIKNENELLKDAINEIWKFGTDYNEMTEEQQYTLGSYVNLMEASTSLLVNPIEGLAPKVTEKLYDEFCSKGVFDKEKCKKYKSAVISIANLLYGIDLDDYSRKLLCNSFKKNDEFLKAVDLDKKEMTPLVVDMAIHCLYYRYAYRPTIV